MNRRRSFTLALLALGAVLIVGQIAQAAPVKARNRQAQVQRMARALGLTQAQKDQIRPILKDTRAQVLAIRRDNSLTPAQKKAQIAQVRKASRQQINTILTPEQRKKWAEIKKHRRSVRRKV